MALFGLFGGPQKGKQASRDLQQATSSLSHKKDEINSSSGARFRKLFFIVGAVGFAITSLFSWKFGGEALGAGGDSFFIWNGHFAGLMFNCAEFLLFAFAGFTKDIKKRKSCIRWGIACAVVSISASMGAIESTSLEGLTRQQTYENLQENIEARKGRDNLYNSLTDKQLRNNQITNNKQTASEAKANLDALDNLVHQQLHLLDNQGVSASASLFVGLSGLTRGFIPATLIATIFAVFFGILLECVTGKMFYLAGDLLNKIFWQKSGHGIEPNLDDIVTKLREKMNGGNSAPAFAGVSNQKADAGGATKTITIEKFIKERKSHGIADPIIIDKWKESDKSQGTKARIAKEVDRTDAYAGRIINWYEATKEHVNNGMADPSEIAKRIHEKCTPAFVELAMSKI
jgi:hypothetical protein